MIPQAGKTHCRLNGQLLRFTRNVLEGAKRFAHASWLRGDRVCQWAPRWAAPSRRSCADFRLVDRNAPVEQIAAVAVTVAEGNAEQPWSRQELSAAIVNVTGKPLLLPCTLALGDDASGCFLLPREVRDRCARMVIGVSDVDAMVRWVNRDLEKVGKAPVGAAK
jgi:hypothetical protein